jgi:hypothetical protein
MYDLRCTTCELIKEDQLLPVSHVPMCDCGGHMERLWRGNQRGVIGDEIDIEIKNGLCHEDGTPRRFRSKAELKRAAKEKGLVNEPHNVGPHDKHVPLWSSVSRDQLEKAEALVKRHYGTE